MARPRTGDRLRKCQISTMGSEGIVSHKSEVFEGAIAENESLTSPDVLTIPGECRFLRAVVSSNAALGSTARLQVRTLNPSGSKGAWEEVSSSNATNAIARGVTTYERIEREVYYQETHLAREFRVLCDDAVTAEATKVAVKIEYGNI